MSSIRNLRDCLIRLASLFQRGGGRRALTDLTDLKAEANADGNQHRARGCCNTTPEDSVPEPPYLFMGSFQVPEAKRIGLLLESKGLRHEIEVDDSGVRNLGAGHSGGSLKGTFGFGVQVRFYIHPEDTKTARQLLNNLYPV